MTSLGEGCMVHNLGIVAAFNCSSFGGKVVWVVNSIVIVWGKVV